MKLYAGLDVSLETTSVCVVDEDGRVRLEAQCLSEPAALIAMLQKAGDGFVRIGLEAGPLSQWLYFGLIEAELPAVCIETRHAKAAMARWQRTRTTGTTPARLRRWCGRVGSRRCTSNPSKARSSGPCSSAALKAWGMRLAKRSSLKKAKIAVARKLAVVMHRMWRDGTPFRWTAGGMRTVD